MSDGAWDEEKRYGAGLPDHLPLAPGPRSRCNCGCEDDAGEFIAARFADLRRSLDDMPVIEFRPGRP